VKPRRTVGNSSSIFGTIAGMRIASLVVLLAACGGTSTQPSGVARTPSVEPVRSAAPAIVMSDKGIATLFGKPLPSEPKASQVLALLGKEDRFLPAGNDLFIYDRFGVVVYRKPDTDQCESIALFYGPTKYDFTPRQLFAGTLSVANVPIPIGMTKDDIDAKLPKNHSGYMYGYGEARPSFDFDDSGKLSMVWLEFKQPGDDF
jgi:hypothetical protein